MDILEYRKAFLNPIEINRFRRKMLKEIGNLSSKFSYISAVSLAKAEIG